MVFGSDGTFTKMNTDDLDFHLPQELIAQTPPANRAAARLLHYRRSDKSVVHRGFGELPELLREGDLLVFNDSRVVPAKIMLQKDTGGRIEGLFIADEGGGRWRVLLKNVGDSRRVLSFVEDPTLSMAVVERVFEGEFRVQISVTEPAVEVLARVGRMPLPPYIKRGKGGDPRDAMDRERYQTVYADQAGSVAAPTAGLHFTAGVMERLAERGVEVARVTLHVGMGTFKPVVAETLEGHAMHTEAYTLSEEAAGAINRAKRQGRRVVAVGTTATRVLESQPAGEVVEVSGETNILIYPPYEWRHVGALITNFHLPRSTLIALVAAWVGLDEQRRIYSEAIAMGYRFFSYGDTSLLE
ncbi:MAG TPA: tRNA preQ1(34) S-adenosylmethionine ribosyltransferase-isomerase QueA [Tepidisphaeraceae bacterium]|jgi:S-adenosylmethionine:tRNA ribosyltransferase-isomerase|nr:tRNA preQ1(34) S-adenosylmethionine ribosyltransferase-isomerase QueA [Tepidisphaeraceae bacterium]